MKRICLYWLCIFCPAIVSAGETVYFQPRDSQFPYSQTAATPPTAVSIQQTELAALRAEISELRARLSGFEGSPTYEPGGSVAPVSYPIVKTDPKAKPEPVELQSARPIVTIHVTDSCPHCAASLAAVENGQFWFADVRIVNGGAPRYPYFEWDHTSRGVKRIYRHGWHEGLPSIIAAETEPTEYQHLPPGQQPTSFAEVHRVLALLHPQKHETFIDYGCGDGRFVIEAARIYGCKAIGVEINHEQAERARRNVAAAGLAGSVRIVEADAAMAGQSADVGVAYLFPAALKSLRPQLEKLDRFASMHHNVPGLEMSRNGDAYIYRKPQPVQQQQAGATWQGYIYSAPVCTSRNCRMCNSIRRQLGW